MEIIIDKKDRVWVVWFSYQITVFESSKNGHDFASCT